MKTKLLRKLRKEADKKVTIMSVINTWDMASVYKVRYSSNRSRQFQTAKYGYNFMHSKKREYILNRIKSIRESSKPVVI